MKTYFTSIFIGLFAMIGFAHNPDVSTTMLVEKDDNQWVLQISASLTAFQQEIKTHFAEYKTPEEFQQMVLEHIKNNFDIKFNDNQAITLSNGMVKLGHETKVIFEVLGVPSDIKKVYIKNSAFKDIHNNKSALVFLKEGFNKEHFTLNNKNNHTLKLVIDDNKFVLETINKASFLSANMGYALLVVLLLGLLYIIKTKKKSNSNN
ncbi:hypothetical protein [Olleya sp. R77988]|uniref:hypothetical protein n=1 Tax=Olleya sp. R77988 TaxID=3093875 RepID=UPI0037C83205